MLKIVALSAALVAFSALPALADAECAEPIAPQQPTGPSVTLKQISDAAHDTNVFMKQSDDYQSCLGREYRQKRDEAEKEKKDLDPSVQQDIDASIDENQKLKQRVGSEFQQAFAAFCKRDPKVDPSCAKYQ
jgi:hypothetical protein